MRIAYLVLAHSRPDLTERLVEKLASQADRVYIHVDARTSILPFETLLSKPYGGRVHFVGRREKCHWGDFSLVQATLNGLEAICESEEEFDYVSLHSGQDYIVKPVADFKSFLAANSGKNFLEYFTLPNSDWGDAGGLDRVKYAYYLELENALRRHTGGHRLIGILRKISRFFPKKGEPFGGNFYGGSQWWTLSIDVIKGILAYLSRNPTYRSFYQTALIPDEIFFQTIVLNIIPSSRAVDDNLRYIRWSGSKPVVVTPAEVEACINSTAFFTRKIDDVQTIEALDAALRCPH